MAASRRAQVLIVIALALAVVLGAFYGREVWADSGWFAVALFGIPLACTALALLVERITPKLVAPAVVAVLRGGCLAWSLLTAGGLGLGFAPSSLLLVAAAVSWVDRRERSSADQRRRRRAVKEQPT